jgi:hypothetical protein
MLELSAPCFSRKLSRLCREVDLMYSLPLSSPVVQPADESRVSCTSTRAEGRGTPLLLLTTSQFTTEGHPGLDSVDCNMLYCFFN